MTRKAQLSELVHVAPPGADWTDHPADVDCLAHIRSAELGEVPYGGHIWGTFTLPEWRPPVRPSRHEDDLTF